MGLIEHCEPMRWLVNRADLLDAEHETLGPNQTVVLNAGHYDRLAAQLTGAVSLAGEAADLLDELTVYWETDDLPPEVGSRFGEVRDALRHLRGQ